jgi:hypothetical protein
MDGGFITYDEMAQYGALLDRNIAHNECYNTTLTSMLGVPDSCRCDNCFERHRREFDYTGLPGKETWSLVFDYLTVSEESRMAAVSSLFLNVNMLRWDLLLKRIRGALGIPSDVIPIWLEKMGGDGLTLKGHFMPFLKVQGLLEDAEQSWALYRTNSRKERLERLEHLARRRERFMSRHVLHGKRQCIDVD